MSERDGFPRGDGERGEPIFLLPRTITIMAAVPLLIVLARSFLSPSEEAWAVLAFAFVPERLLPGGAEVYPGGAGAVVWTFLTHALLHEGWAHVLINTAMFAAIARAVLPRLGTARFLAFSAFATAAGAAAHLVVEWGSDVPMMGASGLVSGLLGALLRFVFRGPWAPTASILESLGDPRVRGAIGALVLMNLVLVFGGTAMVGGDGGGIAWAAHLGGFLAGFLGFSLFEPRRSR